MTPFNVVLIASLLVMCACIVIGLRNLKWITGSARLFVAHASLALLTEISGFIIGRLSHNNHYVFNLYIVGEFILILFAARDYLEYIFKPLAIACFVLFAATLLYDLVHTGPFYAAFHAYTVAWVLLGTVYLILLIRQILQNQTSRSEGINLLACVLLAYFFCSIPRWSLLRYILESFSPSSSTVIAYLTIGLSFFRYAGTAVALWMIAKSAREAGEQKNPSIHDRDGMEVRRSNI